jgi:hypothetical protein
MQRLRILFTRERTGGFFLEAVAGRNMVNHLPLHQMIGNDQFPHDESTSSYIPPWTSNKLHFPNY